MSVNFWKLLFGRMFSNIGSCFYDVSLIWLIYHLTGNTFYTGLAGFLVLVPMMFQFLVGLLIEKFNKKELLIATEIGQIFTVLMAFLLYSTIWPSVWALIFLTPIAAILSMFSNPAEMTLIPQFVDEDKYSQANSLMNVTYQTLTVVFTSLVGVLLAFFYPLTLYALSLLFNICAGICFFTIYTEGKPGENGSSEKESMIRSIREYRHTLISGLNVYSHSFLFKFLPVTVIANLVFGMLNAVLPAYAASRGGSQWYGFYQSAETLGILIGAALVPSLKNIPLGELTIGGFFMSSVFWTISFVTGNNYLSIIFYAASLVAPGITNILFISSIQKVVPKEHLAQFYTLLVSFGACATPLGSLSGGQIAHLWGNGPIFIGISAAFLLVSVYWLAERILRKMPAAGQLGTGEYAIYTAEHRR